MAGYSDSPVVGKVYKHVPLHLSMESKSAIKCDEKGRFRFRAATRKRYGDHFEVIEAPGEIILVPLSDDPVATLQELGRKLPDVSVHELKKRAREHGRRQAGA